MPDRVPSRLTAADVVAATVVFGFATLLITVAGYEPLPAVATALCGLSGVVVIGSVGTTARAVWRGVRLLAGGPSGENGGRT